MERWQNLTRPPISSVREAPFTRWPRILDSSEAGECHYVGPPVSCCRELLFPMRGTQSYVPMTFFFALKPAAVFIAQGGWAYLHKENITTSSLGSVCVALTKFIPHIKITTWISKPPHFYDGIKKLDLWVCFFYPHCPLLNSSTTCFHHHYHSSKHESFIQAVILELRHSLIVPVPACTLQEETSLNVRNQECSSLTFGTGKDVGHACDQADWSESYINHRKYRRTAAVDVTGLLLLIQHWLFIVFQLQLSVVLLLNVLEALFM